MDEVVAEVEQSKMKQSGSTSTPAVPGMAREVRINRRLQPDD